MAFETENSLRAVVLDELPDLFEYSDSPRIFEEYPNGAGKTDIVLSNVSDSYLKWRTDELDIQSAITQSKLLRPFLILHRRGKVTLEYFLELCDFLPKIRESIQWLISEGFVRQEEGKIQTAPNLRRHVTTTYAIELKISNWKRALDQACRSKSYAEYQYVALDGEYVHRAMDNISRFQKYNVGIISASENGDLSIQHRPDREKPCIPFSAWAINESAFPS